MHFASLRLPVFLGLLTFAASLVGMRSVQAQEAPPNGGDFSQQLHPSKKLPTDVILVKGAWASASDSVTPVPEGGKVTGNVYGNPYFDLDYTLSPDWIKKYDGPPPSDSGYYVLAQIQPADTFKGPQRGSILIAAEDLFFTPTQARSTLELINFTRNNLQADYTVARGPAQAPERQERQRDARAGADDRRIRMAAVEQPPRRTRVPEDVLDVAGAGVVEVDHVLVREQRAALWRVESHPATLGLDALEGGQQAVQLGQVTAHAADQERGHAGTRSEITAAPAFPALGRGGPQ